jgi:hypothetical protein
LFNPFCLELRVVVSIPRIQRGLKTRGALERASIEVIGYSKATSALSETQRKEAADRGGLLYAEAQGNESLLQAPQRRNCVPSRDRSAMERFHNSNLARINDRTRAGRRQAAPDFDPRSIQTIANRSRIFSVRDAALLTKVNTRYEPEDTKNCSNRGRESMFASFK